MPDYNRFISYLYYYKNGIKETSAGHARVEQRAGNYKISVRIKCSQLSDSVWDAYFYSREQKSLGKLKSATAGMVQLSKGEADTIFECTKSNIEQAGIPFEQIEGMVFCLHQGREFILSDWEEKGLSSDEVMSIYGGKTEENKQTAARSEVKTEWIGSDSIETIPLEALLADAVHKEVIKAEIENENKDGEVMAEQKLMKTKDDAVELELLPKVETVFADDVQAVKEIVSENDTTIPLDELYKKEVISNEYNTKRVQSQDIRAAIPRNTCTESTWEVPAGIQQEFPADTPAGYPFSANCYGKRMPWQDPPEAKEIFESHERVYPFQDGEIAECVKIEPKDIGKLPVEFWSLGNNSFLLHSFCNYKYLLFAKRMNRIKCEYLLMAPGVYQQREKLMAKMFGFEHFKCVKCREQRLGEFGFWYMMISF